MGADVGGLS